MASSLPSSTAIKRNLPSENLNENQPKRNHWSAGLSTALDDEGARVHKDELCTVIKDKYPKARIHLLVMPNEYIANLKSINNTHLPLLKHMLKVGKEVAEKIAAKADARGSFAHFRYGYHAIPSMSLLHMHVISQDFISDSLKTVCIYIYIVAIQIVPLVKLTKASPTSDVVDLKVGEPFEISFDVGGKEAPKVQLTKDGKEVKFTSVEGTRHVYSIPEVKPEHQGVYKLTAKNKLSTEETNVALNVTGN
ncbi:unnamed protein product [Rotaria sordida]|uniref:HIT domain-containing protein n=1 Tax=Rotaria sordida TaxID=392033 RepID=A0A813WWA2_9BILA|nr:unnamed protein product [Rotaria sordida]